MITPAQCRAARGWLNLTQAELGAMIPCAVSVVIDFERSRRATPASIVIALQRLLEERGISFFNFPRVGIEGPIDDPQTEPPQ